MKKKTQIDHEQMMRKALAQARVALRRDEVPIGAVVIDATGTIIGRGHNAIETVGCQTAHAEVRAIEQACRKVGNWRLEGCSIYVTLEPCLMCFGLIGLSRLSNVVYGAQSPLFGSGLDNKECFPVYSKGLHIMGGVLKDESIDLLQDFFKKRRAQKGST